jgi:hypothetical protein
VHREGEAETCEDDRGSIGAPYPREEGRRGRSQLLSTKHHWRC